MSSEPIERRVSYLGDRLKASRCSCCGKEYFEIRDYCSICGRKSYGKMESIDLFFDKGILELATFINEPTNKFAKLGSFVYGIVSFHDGKIRVPARLTDQMLCDSKNIDLASLEGREVIPRFRRRYSVGKSELIPTISLAFTLADEYYPHQEYKIITPTKDYDLPGIVGYGVYSSRFRYKEESWEHAVPYIDEDSVTAAVEAGKLALIHSALDSALIGKVYAGSESNPYAVKPIAAKVAQVLKLGKEDGDVQSVDAIDTEFACKAGSSMFKDACALVSYPKSGINYAMVIGTNIGAGKSVSWPTGLASSGNTGVASSIIGTDYSIGYVELAYTLENHMTVAAVQNPSGNYVLPTLASTTAAAQAATNLPSGIESWASITLLNTNNADAYPIVTFTYLIVYKELNTFTDMTEAKATALVQFLWYVVHDGQSQASALQYAPLPSNVVAINEATIQSITFNGHTLPTS